MMKMTAKMFGVLCAASLVFCAACDGIGNKDEDENKKDVEVSYDVGSIVSFEGKDYLVVKNTAVAGVVAEQSLLLGYYPNVRADAFRDQLLAEQGMTEYVVLFDTTTTKAFPTTATYWDDTYMILHDGKKQYRIRYRWETLVEDFANRTATDLRQHYDPTAVVIDNYNTVYGSDLSKKIFDRYAFNYGEDGKTVTYTGNMKERESYKDYAQINGKERNRYSFYDRIQSNARSYRLRNPNLDTDVFFFEFRVDFEEDRETPKLYRLIANGTGTKEGSASSSLYQCNVKINKVEYNASLDNVRIKGSVKIEMEDPIDVSVPAGFEDEWMSVSSEKISIGGYNVPKTITFSAPFEDTSVPLNAYTKVTFVPELKNGGVNYVPKPDTSYPYDFLAQFAKGYQALFENGGSSSQPDIELQPDTDIESDKTTPRFVFSGDSVKIELEEMKHNFVLSGESGASKGTAGKLVDENSRAEAIITFPAGKYEGYAVIRAPSGDNDAFYVKFGDNYIRMYADDPLPTGYARTSRTPINLSCSEEMTVRMTIQQNSPNKKGETGMFIDYVEFTKTGSQGGQGEASGSEDKLKVTYKVGTLVTMGSGNTYLVTKNSESADGSVAVGTVTTDWGTYYQNESAVAYREKLLAEHGVTAYIELFDIASEKGDAKLDDKYIVLRDGRRYYTITQSWVKANMPAEGAADFANMIENDLREQYDPNVVQFANESADFGNDLSKKIYKKYTFAYDDYNRVDFSDDNMIQFDENKAYRWINGGAQSRAAYAVGTTKKTDGRKMESCSLKEGMVNKSFSNFDRYSDGTYRVSCKGEGTLGGTTDDQVYQNLITIRKLQYSADAPAGEIDYTVIITKSGKKEIKDYTSFDPNEHNCLEVSGTTVTVSGISVPATITFIARYEDAGALLGKYTKLIFEPQARQGMVVYEPKTDMVYGYDFVRQFVDDYPSLYAGSFPSL